MQEKVSSPDSSSYFSLKAEAPPPTLPPFSGLSTSWCKPSLAFLFFPLLPLLLAHLHHFVSHRSTQILSPMYQQWQEWVEKLACDFHQPSCLPFQSFQTHFLSYSSLLWPLSDIPPTLSLFSFAHQITEGFSTRDPQSTHLHRTQSGQQIQKTHIHPSKTRPDIYIKNHLKHSNYRSLDLGKYTKLKSQGNILPLETSNPF